MTFEETVSGLGFVGNRKIIHGNCIDVLKTLPEGIVQTCVTSPPYFGLRRYGTEPQVWGGDPQCKHDWATDKYYREGGASESSAEAFSEPGPDNAQRIKDTRWHEDTVCTLCNAWRGELGGEPIPELYIEHLVSVFREVRRVLSATGTLWLNLGDSYSGSMGNRGDAIKDDAAWRREGTTPIKRPSAKVAGIKPKDLVGIPWMAAFALRADGWYLRSDIIWEKPAPMPESVKDRPTKSHEYIFLLTKNPSYFYDIDAIREPMMPSTAERYEYGWAGNEDRDYAGGKQNNFRQFIGSDKAKESLLLGRNKRSVWSVNTKPLKDAHFATFPPKLIEPCVLAGTSMKGCCPKCGTCWERITEVDRPDRPKLDCDNMDDRGVTRTTAGLKAMAKHGVATRLMAGWKQPCECDAPEPVPCVVLDPFSGAGTTGLVATGQGRRYVGIELNPAYIDMAHERLSNPLLEWTNDSNGTIG